MLIQRTSELLYVEETLFLNLELQLGALPSTSKVKLGSKERLNLPFILGCNRIRLLI